LAYAAKLYREARKLKEFKGPFGTSVSKLWMVKASVSRRTHLELFDVNERYGQS